ncbi:hypothetical protein ABER68_00815 [Paenibacillus alvei]
MGIYGLLSANGLSEYTTGKDMFGNELTDQQRQASLTQSIFTGLPFVPGMAKEANRLGQQALNSTVQIGKQGADVSRAFMDDLGRSLNTSPNAAFAGGVGNMGSYLKAESRADVGKVSGDKSEYLSMLSGRGSGTGNIDHSVRVYRDIDDAVLNKEYEIITRKGSFVTKIVADDNLVVDMPYLGKGKQSTNSEGWLRDNKFYFNDANIKNLNNGWAIVYDAVFRKHFPQYDIVGLKGKPLVHHHIGGGGQAMAIPQPLHPGSGGIHNIEKQIGIWGKDQENAECLQVFIK